MSKFRRQTQTRDDPYQGVLTICRGCGHVSLQALQEDGLYKCPTCPATMKEVKV